MNDDGDDSNTNGNDEEAMESDSAPNETQAASQQRRSALSIGSLRVPCWVAALVVVLIVCAAVAVGVAVPLSRNGGDNGGSSLVSAPLDPALNSTVTPTASDEVQTVSPQPSMQTSRYPSVGPTVTTPVASPGPTLVPSGQQTSIPSALFSSMPSGISPSQWPMPAASPGPTLLPSGQQTSVAPTTTFPSPPVEPTPLPTRQPPDLLTWNTMGDNGLTLQVMNALDDDWQEIFALAVSDWDSGEPDVLTLSTTRVALDSRCLPVSGVLKVCNGNYGATNWKGISQQLISDGFIVSSVSKMNEYYLEFASNAERQHIMCHEVRWID